MIDLEWWQLLLAIVAGLGFSAAPWIAALLAGKLRPLSWVIEQLGAKDKAYNDMVAEKDKQLADKDVQIERALADAISQEEGKGIERKRGDDAFRETVALAREFGATTVHLLRALPSVEDEDGSHA